MIRHATIFWVAIAGLFLTALTVVGSEVRERDRELNMLHAAIAREHENIHVLKAELAYLSSPERIAELAGRELGMAEFGAGRVMTIASLPRYLPIPELELESDPGRPLLLSSAHESDQPAFVAAAAAFLPPPRLESAGLLHQTAWTMNELEQRPE